MKKAFTIKPINSAKDHQAALKLIADLWDAPPRGPEHDALEVLSILVENYEARVFPFDDPDPVEAILFRMEQQGLSRKDLESIFGSRSRVSEILNRRRALSLSMIRRLHDELQIPFEALIPHAWPRLSRSPAPRVQRA